MFIARVGRGFQTNSHERANLFECEFWFLSHKFFSAKFPAAGSRMVARSIVVAMIAKAYGDLLRIALPGS